MWSTTVVLGVVLSYYQVFGEGISDVTTVYKICKGNVKVMEDQGNVGQGQGVNESINNEKTDSEKETDHGILPSAMLPPPILNTTKETSCINGVIGRVHSRTNALGMGLIDKQNNFVDTINMEQPKITFDASCLSQEICKHWDFANRSALIDDTTQTRPIKSGKAYKVRPNMMLNIHDIESHLYIFFTQGPKDLQNEKIHFVVKFFGRNSGKTPHVYYNCKARYVGESFKGYQDEKSFTVYCTSQYSDFQISYHNDYLTFDFTQGVQIYRGMGESKDLVIDFNYAAYRDINYFSISPTSKSNAYSISLVTGDLKVTQEGVVSAGFTPQSDEICLAIIFHSSVASLTPELDILVLGSKDREYFLDTIQNVKSGWNIKVINRKLRDMSQIKLKIQKTGLANISIARIASCNPDGEEVLELLTPISVCPNDRKSLPENLRNSSLNVYSTVADDIDPAVKIRDTNKKCWNGGVLTSAGCACPPGFIGPHCEIGCGRNKFGQDCEGLCSLRSEECRGLLMCTKFTGCHCAPGYTGADCTQACAPGWYGNDCLQQCSHCAGNSSCDIYNGECTSCEEGYLAPHCKLVSVYYGSKPEVTSPDYGTIVVSFDPNKYITVAETPQLYQIQFRKKGDQWQLYTTKPLQRFTETSEKAKKISEKIEGLVPGSIYQVRVLMMDDNLIKYDGDLVQVAEVLSKCDVPDFYDYKLTSTANTSSIKFSWRYAIDEKYSCPLEQFKVTWKEGWKWTENYTDKEDFTLTGLSPGVVIKFKVQAITTGGSVRYSKTVITSTQQSIYPAVQNLHVGPRQSTSVDISWEPPRGFGDSQLQYTISYKCVDRPACSPGCQDVSEGQVTQEGTTITLGSLLPFTKYLVTISAEGGAETSIYVGTTKAVPTEVPILSVQSPVTTSTSVTVFWDQGPVCTGYLLGYNYQLTQASDALKVLARGFTKETNASFHNLTANTEYVIKVYVTTVAGWNPQSYLTITINTSATD